MAGKVVLLQTSACAVRALGIQRVEDQCLSESGDIGEKAKLADTSASARRGTLNRQGTQTASTPTE